MRRILCLYMTIGSGHRMAANAIRQALLTLTPEVEVRSLDPLAQRWDGFVPVANFINAGMLMLPDFYDRSWQTGNARFLGEGLAKFRPLMSIFEKVLDEFRPEVVVCTHALPCRVLTRLKDRRPELKLVGVITDFGVHPYWPTEQVDLYAVPSEEARGVLEHRGVRREIILPTGIPVNPIFSERRDARQAALALGLNPDEPMVLIIAGAAQFGPYVQFAFQLTRLLRNLTQLPNSVQVVVVTGLNDKLKRRLEAQAGHLDRPVRVLGYVDYLSDLMRAATVIVSKAGGLIMAEALAAARPLIVMPPGQGQERMNAEYLVRNGAGFEARDWREALRLLDELLRDPQRRQAMTERAKSLGKSLAAVHVAQSVMGLGMPVVNGRVVESTNLNTNA